LLSQIQFVILRLFIYLSPAYIKWFAACHIDPRVYDRASLILELIFLRDSFLDFDSNDQGCSGAGTRWNAVPANILKPERRSGKYRCPEAER
jgi:hypothetical protein